MLLCCLSSHCTIVDRKIQLVDNVGLRVINMMNPKIPTDSPISISINYHKGPGYGLQKLGKFNSFKLKRFYFREAWRG